MEKNKIPLYINSPYSSYSSYAEHLYCLQNLLLMMSSWEPSELRIESTLIIKTFTGKTILESCCFVKEDCSPEDPPENKGECLHGSLFYETFFSKVEFLKNIDQLDQNKTFDSKLIFIITLNTYEFTLKQTLYANIKLFFYLKLLHDLFESIRWIIFPKPEVIIIYDKKNQDFLTQLDAMLENPDLVKKLDGIFENQDFLPQLDVFLKNPKFVKRLTAIYHKHSIFSKLMYAIFKNQDFRTLWDATFDNKDFMTQLLNAIFLIEHDF